MRMRYKYIIHASNSLGIIRTVVTPSRFSLLKILAFCMFVINLNICNVFHYRLVRRFEQINISKYAFVRNFFSILRENKRIYDEE